MEPGLNRTHHLDPRGAQGALIVATFCPAVESERLSPTSPGSGGLGKPWRPRPGGSPMDALSRIATTIEDLIELPKFLAIRRSLQAAGAGAFRTMGYVCRDQAEKIPDRVALRFEREEVTFGAFNAGVNRYASLLKRLGAARGDVVELALPHRDVPDLLLERHARVADERGGDLGDAREVVRGGGAHRHGRVSRCRRGRRKPRRAARWIRRRLQRRPHPLPQPPSH